MRKHILTVLILASAVTVIPAVPACIARNTRVSDTFTAESPAPKAEVRQTKKHFSAEPYQVFNIESGEVLKVPVRDYVIGAVMAEMPASFDKQALMAQAVLARTYALKAIKKGQILTDNNATQNYKDNNQLKNIWENNYDIYYNKIKQAVNETKGAYLTYNNDYIEAVYHSTSNGKTEDSINVWGNSFPYLISVESIYDNYNPSFSKEQIFSYDELSNKLSMDININTNFNILSLTSSGRIDTIEINGMIFKGTTFRNKLGLRSTDVEITKTNEGVIFKTKGYGHGVGMSQYGANGMAKNGYNWIQILNHYYPGTNLNYL